MDKLNPDSEDDRGCCSCVQKPICTPFVNNPAPPQAIAEYGWFYKLGSFTVAAENAVAFEHRTVSRNIEYTNGSIFFKRAGVYYINYMIHFPTGSPASLRFYLERNNQPVEGSYSVFAEQTGTISGQIIINVRTNTKLELVSTTSAEFINTSTTDTAATLAIIQLDCHVNNEKPAKKDCCR